MNILLLLLLMIYVAYTLIVGLNLQFEYFSRFLFVIHIVCRGILSFKIEMRLGQYKSQLTK